MSTVCSYTGQMTATLVSFHRSRIANQFTMKVKIFPPLYIFKLSDQVGSLREIFNIENSGIDLNDISYDSKTG